MTAEQARYFIRNEYKPLSKFEILGGLFSPVIAIKKHAELFLYEYALYELLLTDFFICAWIGLFVWVIYILIIRTLYKLEFVRMRYLYMGSGYFLGVIIFSVTAIRYLLVYGDSLLITLDVSIIVVLTVFGIMIGLILTKDKIHEVLKEEKKAMSLKLLYVLVLCLVALGFIFARISATNVSLPSINESPLFFVVLLSVLSSVYSFISILHYYRIYLLFKYKLLKIKA